MKASRGFTLLELVTVVIIIGILANIGVPHFFKVLERAKAAEAVGILGSLRRAQLIYAIEHGSTAANISDLGLTIQQPRYFNHTLIYTVARPHRNINRTVAEMFRNDLNNPYGHYWLSIRVNGNLTCWGDQAGCQAIGITSQ